MRIIYTGRQVELKPAQFRKLEAQCAKVGKLLDGKHECEGRFVLSHERHLHKAEVTVSYHDHSLVAIAEDGDLFTAIHAAAVKLEKQALKVRAKWRDSKRVPRKEMMAEGRDVHNGVIPRTAPKVEQKSGPANGKSRAKAPAPNRTAQVRHAGEYAKRKPMTLEEAMLEVDGREYVAFLNAETGLVNVLVRRADGDFDLVEA